MRAIDLTGKKFGRWTVVSFACRKPYSGGFNRYWTCRCECGTVQDVAASTLTSRAPNKSCGCLSRESASIRFRTHGMTRTPEHRTWISLRRRCNSPVCPSYSDYGARGIRVCERWDSFESFLADMGPKPSSKHTIERNDNNGPYSPENCRWATRGEQMRNTRRTRMLTHNGITMCLTDWAKHLGFNRELLRDRLTDGWSVERALSTPRLR